MFDWLKRLLGFRPSETRYQLIIPNADYIIVRSKGKTYKVNAGKLRQLSSVRNRRSAAASRPHNTTGSTRLAPANVTRPVTTQASSSAQPPVDQAPHQTAGRTRIVKSTFAGTTSGTRQTATRNPIRKSRQPRIASSSPGPASSPTDGNIPEDAPSATPSDRRIFSRTRASAPSPERRSSVAVERFSSAEIDSSERSDHRVRKLRLFQLPFEENPVEQEIKWMRSQRKQVLVRRKTFHLPQKSDVPRPTTEQIEAAKRGELIGWLRQFELIKAYDMGFTPDEILPMGHLICRDPTTGMVRYEPDYLGEKLEELAYMEGAWEDHQDRLYYLCLSKTSLPTYCFWMLEEEESSSQGQKLEMSGVLQFPDVPNASPPATAEPEEDAPTEDAAASGNLSTIAEEAEEAEEDEDASPTPQQQHGYTFRRRLPAAPRSSAAPAKKKRSLKPADRSYRAGSESSHPPSPVLQKPGKRKAADHPEAAFRKPSQTEEETELPSPKKNTASPKPKPAAKKAAPKAKVPATPATRRSTRAASQQPQGTPTSAAKTAAKEKKRAGSAAP